MSDLEFDQAPPWSPEVPDDEAVFAPGRKDPFLGKCIHGVDGARFVEGKLRSRDCAECAKD